MDVRRERVVAEMEAKGERIALRWFYKNYEKVFKNPQLNPEQIPKNAAKLYTEIVQSRRRLLRWQKENEEKWRQDRKAVEVERKLPKYTIEDLSRGPMYPVPDEVLQLLFSGVSHNDEGRRAYLRARYDIGPEKRYYDPITSTQEYGWDVRKRAWKPYKEHCRSSIVMNSFYRRTGALEGDDPMRKQPYTSAHVATEIL